MRATISSENCEKHSCQYISYDMIVGSYEWYTHRDESYCVLLNVPVQVRSWVN